MSILVQCVTAAFCIDKKTDFPNSNFDTFCDFVCSCNILSPPISPVFMFFDFEVGFMSFF